jgi:hypothetical protein
MLKKSIAVLVLALGIACCAAPAGVPRGASVQTSLLNGTIWSWSRRLEHGCVDWSATDLGGAEVQLSVDPAKCEGGPGLHYDAALDYMEFQNFWPGEPDDGANSIIFGSDGMASGIRPCPHTLSPEQLATLRVVAHEALARATTDPERRVLERIDQRIAATNGATLASAQTGCIADTPEGAMRPRVNMPGNAWDYIDTSIVPCADLPAGAATNVPPPFDQYLQLVCTRSGQALKPVDGYQWVFAGLSAQWQWAMNRQSPAPTDHFVALTAEPLSDAEVVTLRDAVSRDINFKRVSGDYNADPTIARLSLQTSSGEHWQIYLLTPPQGSSPDAPVIGLRCRDDCLPLYMGAVFFTVTRAS